MLINFIYEGINADIWSRFSVTDVTGFVPPEPVDINPEVAPVSDTQTDKVDPLAVALPIFFLLLLLLIAILLLALKRKWCRKGYFSVHIGFENYLILAFYVAIFFDTSIKRKKIFFLIIFFSWFFFGIFLSK